MTRKALCVGVNQFKNYPGAALQGCVNDAHAMAALLRDFLGFHKSDILTLTDTEATKTNIMSRLLSLVDGAKAGKFDYLVFSLSSHGTQIPDTHGDEPDKYDEAFCPHDLAQTKGKWDPRYIILDDELHDLLIQLPENVLVEVYLDTCHSGTGLRAADLLPERKPRYLPPPSVEALAEIEGRAPRGLVKKLLRQKVAHHILWAACRDDQTSADAQIAGSWHGAFTYFFCKELRACKGRLPRAELLKKVRADLLSGHYSQVPQLECEATLRNVPLMEFSHGPKPEAVLTHA